MDISVIRPLLSEITFPKMDLFNGFELEASEIQCWFKNPRNRNRVFSDDFLDGIEDIKNSDDNEQDLEDEFDISQQFQCSEQAFALIGLSRVLERQVELVYKNPVFNTVGPPPLANINLLLDLNAQFALQLGLDFGRVESFVRSTKIMFENHTILTQKFSEKELLAMSSSAVGSRKNLKRRTKAIKWIEQNLNANPELSINALAKALHSKSSAKLDGFERTIPLSTAKDWVRKVKNERQAG
tara:strand:+ start:1778 stop:2500 length:723 start_codon:yes stop_codon:yes gene_type:complete